MTTPARQQLDDALATLPKRWHKFGARPATVDSIRFASSGEARYWSQLKLRQLAGEIDDLERQVRFPLVVNGVPVTTYIADFRHRVVATGEIVVSDFKGFLTPEYKIKRALMLAIHGITITEITRARR
jgi:hypothetical protein